MSAQERAATRRRLMEAGKREFAERGLAGARFDEIAVAAGHAKGTIYNYFASKEELFFAIVREWCQLMCDDPPVGCGSARATLRAIAAADVAIARADPDLARVVVQQMPALSGDHGAQVAHAIAPAVELIAAAFAQGLASGEFDSPVDPATLARLFVGCLSVFELEALSTPSALALDDVPDLVNAHFLAGLARP